VAIILIQGVIMPRMDLFTLLFGGTVLDCLAKDFQNALESDEVKAILLDIDSPGGVAVGTSEMVDIIFNAHTKKPVWSYVGRNCCSAAYWLAIAAKKIITHKSALL
jgi:ClpP class serine protease